MGIKEMQKNGACHFRRYLVGVEEVRLKEPGRVLAAVPDGLADAMK